MLESSPTLSWQRPVRAAKFLRRYKRFFADIELDSGEVVVAHVPNSGSMKSCTEPHAACLISSHDDPARKLKYTLEAVAGPEGWIGVNTQHPNALAEAAFRARILDRWHGWDRTAREVKISEHSRTDLVLWRSQEFSPDRPTRGEIDNSAGPRFHFIEVKNVTLADGKRGLFPDSVTERGLKHVRELESLMAKGHTAEFLFIIQRTDVDHFSPASAIDPDYARALVEAHKRGLLISPHVVTLSAAGFHLQAQPLPFLTEKF